MLKNGGVSMRANMALGIAGKLAIGMTMIGLFLIMRFV
jgi:hypothetical protein